MYWQHLSKRLQLTRKACVPQVQLILILLNSFFKYEMIVYPCNPLSEIAEMVEEILGMANPSICGIANAPDPALLKLRKLM